jgi:hypothetical protein
MTDWQPFREPLRATLVRTVAIALVAGAILSSRWGGLAQWPLATALMLWPSFGGHWLDFWFLNWLRPRLPDRRVAQAAARLGVWFAGGIVFVAAMRLTAIALAGPRRPLVAWWIAGLGFVGVELIAHLALHLRGRPSFVDGRG